MLRENIAERHVFSHHKRATAATTASTREVPDTAIRAVADSVIDSMQEVDQVRAPSWIIELNCKGDLDSVRLHH